MKIYTRGGDRGETGLFGGERVAKHHARVAAYGEVDELNAALGLAASAGLPEDLDALVRRLQEELFVAGADLATPPGAVPNDRETRLSAGAAESLEAVIDRLEAELSPLRSFILPGGGPAGAALHLARTVCRRAERATTALGATGENVSAPILPYLNRLSDLLFVMARVANARDGRPETPWKP